MQLSTPTPVTTRVVDRGRDEDGFTLVFVALTIVVIMIFVAMSVDLGAGFSERREDQSAADGAALAAAQVVSDTTKRDTAISYAERTLSTTATTTGLSDASLDWNSCVGDTPDDADVTISAPSANCVRFSLDRAKVWVKIPDQQIAFFAPAAGLDPITHTASAIAERNAVGLGGILPFAFPNGSGHLCLRSNSGNADEPCDGASTGNFGEADFSVFEVSGCANTSSPLNNTKRFLINMAGGVDHEVARYDGITREDAAVCNGAQGPANAVRPSGGLTRAETGRGMLYGFTELSTSYTGRLAQGISGWWGASHRTTINGTNVDNVALHEFLGDNTNANHPVACRKDLFVDTSGPDGSILGNGANFNSPDQTQARDYMWDEYGDPTAGSLTTIQQATLLRVLMERCFTHFVGGQWDDNGEAEDWFEDLFDDFPLLFPGYSDGAEGRGDIAGGGCANVATNLECTLAIFTRADDASDHGAKIDMQLTSRFGYTPILVSEFASNNDLEPIQRFRAVYITLTCGNNCVTHDDPGTGNNTWAHYPGFPVVQGGNNNFQAGVGDITGFVFSDNMLPFDLGSPGAPFAIDRNVTVELIR